MVKFYYVECLNGHVWREPEDSELGQKAAAREAKGFIDALHVPCRHCEDCEMEDRKNRMIGEFTDEQDNGFMEEDPMSFTPYVSEEADDGKYSAEDDDGVLDLMAAAEDRSKAWDDLEPGER